MSAAMRVLAIDQGTSATKAVVIEPDGTTAAVVEVPVTVVSDAPGAVETDPEAMWLGVVAAGSEALARAGGVVDAIGFANQGETIVAWDRRTGRANGPAVVWQDRRAAGVCAALADDDRRWLANHTGLEVDPYFVAPKIAWLRNRVGSAPTITTIDTWLLHRLCGRYVTDVATASRSLLSGLDDLRWSDRACALFGIDAAEMPEIVSNTTPIGETTAFGSKPIPITGLCVDQQAALFAEGCHSRGATKCTYGTGAFLLAHAGGRPARSTNGLVGSAAWQLGGEAATWCLDGQVYTAGAAVTWLIASGIIDEPADLDRFAGAVASSGEAQFVPGLAGLAAPFWEPEARGSFTGLSLSTGRGELVRAVIDGIAAAVAWLVRAAEADLGDGLTTLRVDGGLTRSRVLLQAQADLAQVPVEVYPSPHATALGVGAFARIGLGGDMLDRPVAGMVIEPTISRDEADSRLQRWRVAAEATKHL